VPTGGVGSHFVAVLGADRQAASRRAAVMALVGVLLTIPAYFLYPWQGLVAHLIAVLAGLLAGNLLAKSQVRRYEASLRGTWKSWMRWSVASQSVGEIYHRVTGRSQRNRPYLLAGALTALWALEVGLLLLAFQDTSATWMALPIIFLNGLLPGLLVSFHLHLRHWVRQFADSVSDMVAAGEIGVWGVL
jgi:hypothetical protein